MSCSLGRHRKPWQSELKELTVGIRGPADQPETAPHLARAYQVLLVMNQYIYIIYIYIYSFIIEYNMIDRIL